MELQPASRVAVFDVCDTLFSTNTTLGFLRFYARVTSDRAISRALDRWTSRSSPAFYLGALAFRLLRWDLGRTRLIRSLRGRSRNELESAARDYATVELAGKLVKPVHERLQEHLRCGDRVLLASSSLDLIIAPVARCLGVEWVASQLEFANDICTGRLATDLTGRKPPALAALLTPGVSLHVYTDNRSDRDLLNLADQRTVIVPRSSKRGRWAGEDCEYLPV